MIAMEKSEFKNVAAAMSDEEKQIAVKTIPDEILIKELERRVSTMHGMINAIREVVRVNSSEI